MMNSQQPNTQLVRCDRPIAHVARLTLNRPAASNAYNAVMVAELEQCLTWCEQQPDIRTVNAQGRTNFSITFRAGDPIKYHWDDPDPQGYTRKYYDSNTSSQVLPNIGTADVTGVFTITGPVGAGTRIGSLQRIADRHPRWSGAVD